MDPINPFFQLLFAIPGQSILGYIITVINDVKLSTEYINFGALEEIPLRQFGHLGTFEESLLSPLIELQIQIHGEKISVSWKMRGKIQIQILFLPLQWHFPVQNKRW